MLEKIQSRSHACWKQYACMSNFEAKPACQNCIKVAHSTACMLRRGDPTGAVCSVVQSRADAVRLEVPQAPAKLAASDAASSEAAGSDAESCTSSAARDSMRFGALPTRLARPGSLAARRPPGMNPGILSEVSTGSADLPRPVSALPRAPLQQRRPSTAGGRPCPESSTGLAPRSSTGPSLRARAGAGVQAGCARLHAQPFAAGAMQRTRSGGSGLAERRAGQ